MAWRLFLSSSQPCRRPGEGLQGVGVEEEFAGGVELDAFGATWTDVAADPPDGVAVAGLAVDGAVALLAADGAAALLAADGAVELLAADGAVELLAADGAGALLVAVTGAACEGPAAPAAGRSGVT